MMLDSGAFSVLNSGKVVDIGKYKEFADEWGWRMDSVAGLDDIEGNWKRSLKNYEVLGFPTFHNSDPDELLDDLIPIARDRGGWIGLGINPINGNRQYADRWVERSLNRIPDDLHVHGWAMRGFLKYGRLDSVDSTNWFRDAHAILSRGIPLHWLTEGEAIEIVIKRYQREHRQKQTSKQVELF